jgi:hypothetical protein
MTATTPADLEWIRAVTKDPGAAIITTRLLSQSTVCIVLSPAAANARWFFKRACVRDLMRQSPRNPESKWTVALKSFLVEHACLRSGAVLAAVDGQDFEVLALDRGTAPPQFDSVFRTLTSCLEPPQYIEHNVFDQPCTEAVLDHLARFHAKFWDRLSEHEDLVADIWPRGG